jgi:S-DNA-T family DNA segregation ATPase FtsK/SpoIIIE
VTLTVEAGPDSTARVELAPGRHVVGRAASADVRIDDPDLELHHLVVDVDPAGRTAIVQLAGRSPVRDVALGAGDDRPAGASRLLRAGGSRVRLEAMPSGDDEKAATLGVTRGDGRSTVRHGRSPCGRRCRSSRPTAQPREVEPPGASSPAPARSPVAW